VKTVAKTVRFSEIVRECGAPEPVTFWQEPEKDRDFKRAVAGQRIMTVKQENVGTKKDFGVAGFYREPNAAYLIFPKSLQAYEGKRVVGIKYDLLAKSKPKGPMAKVRPQSTGTAGPAAIPEKAATARSRARFRVTIRFTATVETALEVEAENKTAAKEQALKSTADQRPDFSMAPQSQKVLKIEEI